MNEILLIERLAVEIETATAKGDPARARKLATLQRVALARLTRHHSAEPAASQQPKTPRRAMHA